MHINLRAVFLPADTRQDNMSATVKFSENFLLCLHILAPFRCTILCLECCIRFSVSLFSPQMQSHSVLWWRILPTDLQGMLVIVMIKITLDQDIYLNSLLTNLSPNLQTSICKLADYVDIYNVRYTWRQNRSLVHLTDDSHCACLV